MSGRAFGWMVRPGGVAACFPAFAFWPQVRTGPRRWTLRDFGGSIAVSWRGQVSMNWKIIRERGWFAISAFIDLLACGNLHSFNIVPFLNTEKRGIHFAKHGHEFGAQDEFEYERMADEFVMGPIVLPTDECVRESGGDRVRFNPFSHYFGAASTNPRFVRTFYIPRAEWINSHGGNSGFLAYECGRVDL